MDLRKERELITKIGNRHFRKKSRLCLAEGLRCCQEAVSRMPNALEAVYCSASFRESSHWIMFRDAARNAHGRIVELTDREFSSLADTGTPQGVMVVLKMPEIAAAAVAGKPFTLILDQVADPGNLGTILRTAWAVGLDSCWLVKGSADPFSPKAVRAGMGAQFAMNVFEMETLEDAVKTAKSFGVKKIWCTMPAGGISVFDSGFCIRDSALIIGNEANGISRPELGEAVTIPMPGCAESLNVAQAATVFLVESMRPEMK